MVVAFIGPKRLPRSALLAIRMWEVISKLISEEEADAFLFTNEGSFDDCCWLIVSQLQTRHPEVRRIYMCGTSEDKLPEIKKGYEKGLLFDELCKDGILAQSVRYKLMIELCDVVVIYLDFSLLQNPRIMSDEESALEYARIKKKRIINLAEIK